MDWNSSKYHIFSPPQVLMKGERFFDCQIGFVGCQAMCLKGIMGIKDFEENMNRNDEVSILQY